MSNDNKETKETKEEIKKEEKPSFDANGLVGKTEADALTLAKEAGWKTRVKERDGLEFFGDMQYIETRVNLYITNNTIRKVEVG